MKTTFRMLSIAALLLLNKTAAATIYPNHVLFKKYNAQVMYMDSLDKILFEWDYSKANTEYTKLSKWASGKGDKQLAQLYILYNYNMVFSKRKQDDNFLDNMLTFLNELEDNKFDYIKAEALELIADYYWFKKQNAAGLEYNIRAYETYSRFSVNDFPHKPDLLYDIGGRYYFFRDFVTARKYFLEVWKETPFEKIDNGISKLNSLALTYRNLNMYDSAIYYFTEALHYALKTNDEIWIGLINGNIGSIKIKQGKLDEAIPLMEINIKISRKLGELADVAMAISQLGAVYLIKKDYEKAMAMQMEALSIIKQKNLFKAFEITSRIYPNIADAYAANGNMTLAYSFADSAAAAKDSVEKNRNIVFIAGVQQKLDVEKHKAELLKKEAEVKHERLYRNTLMGGFTIVMLFSIVFFVQKKRIIKGKKLSDKLLLNILPSDVAEELKKTGKTEARDYEMATVMFTDFKDFTKISEQLSPAKLVEDIDYCFSAFDNIINKYKIEKIKTIGDSYMCVGGLPSKNITHPQDVVRAAIDIRNFMKEHNKEKVAKGENAFEIRIGLHTGPVVAGIVGVKKFAYDIWGDTVNLASRMESNSEAGKINISGATYELIKDEFNFVYRGKVEAKNRGMIDMYFVMPEDEVEA